MRARRFCERPFFLSSFRCPRRPIVLSTLSGRVDIFPTMLVASIVSLYVTGDESIIKAARKRFLRRELKGTELMTDRK